MANLMLALPLPAFIALVIVGYMLALAAVVLCGVALRTLACKILGYTAEDANIRTYPTEVAIRNW